MSNLEPFLNELPEELLEKIASYLEPRSFLRLSETSKRIRSATSKVSLLNRWNVETIVLEYENFKNELKIGIPELKATIQVKSEREIYLKICYFSRFIAFGTLELKNMVASGEALQALQDADWRNINFEKLIYREEAQPGWSQEVINFNKFQEETWFKLYDENRRELSQMAVHVVADKGFHYSHVDGCFVNQKENHFQISVNIEANDDWPPCFVHINGHLHPITEMKLAFAGVKSEMPSSEIQIKQSQTYRSSFIIKLLGIPPRQLTKVTMSRLHFSETTMNNQRKNSRPNPDQKFFLLVVGLLAVTEDGAMHCVQAYASEKVIVRIRTCIREECPDLDDSMRQISLDAREIFLQKNFNQADFVSEYVIRIWRRFSYVCPHTPSTFAIIAEICFRNLRNQPS